MAGNEYGGWSGTPNAAGTRPVSAFARVIMHDPNIGSDMRQEDVFAFRDQPGYKQELGRARRAPGGSYPSKARNSGMAPRFSGSNTGSDPGAHNWATFENMVDRAAEGIRGAIDYRMEDKRMARAREAQKSQDIMETYRRAMDPNFDVTGAYQQGFNQYQTVTAAQRAQGVTNAYQAAWGQPDPFGGAYSQAAQGYAAAQAKLRGGAPLQASQNVTAGVFAQNNPVPVAGSASPLKGRKNAPVNLLNPPGSAPAAQTPPVASRLRKQNQTQKRKKGAKSTAPAIKPPTAP